MVDHNSRVPLFQHQNRITRLGGSYSSAVFSCMNEIGPGGGSWKNNSNAQRSFVPGSEGTSEARKYPRDIRYSFYVVVLLRRRSRGGKREKEEKKRWKEGNISIRKVISDSTNNFYVHSFECIPYPLLAPEISMRFSGQSSERSKPKLKQQSACVNWFKISKTRP